MPGTIPCLAAAAASSPAPPRWAALCESFPARPSRPRPPALPDRRPQTGAAKCAASGGYLRQPEQFPYVPRSPLRLYRERSAPEYPRLSTSPSGAASVVRLRDFRIVILAVLILVAGRRAD